MAGPQRLLFVLALVSCEVLLTALPDEGGGGADSRRVEDLKTKRFSRSVANGSASITVTDCCSPSLPPPAPRPLPPRPRIILLGETGVGKSSLGNRLFGVEKGGQGNRLEGMCASPKFDPNHPTFGVGDSLESHTISTDWIAGKWLGDISGNSSCFTVIDTPGVGDTEGRDCIHGEVIGKEVKRLSPIDAFVLLFKGTNSRFTDELQEQLSFYQELFGYTFWNRTIIEISYWSHNTVYKRDRLFNRKLDEGKMARELNQQLRKKFGFTQTIPVVFVDPMYREIFGIVPEEKAAFKAETEKLWNFIRTGDPYTCEGNCKSPGFLKGKPTLTSPSNVTGRIGAKVVMNFNIWFSGCDANGTSERNYNIYKDGVLIWTVVDEQGDSDKQAKPIDNKKNANTPANMEVFDECSQTKGVNKGCDFDLAKYKKVLVVLSQVTDAHFGIYSLNNTKGGAVVQVEKMVDGFYSPWTSWSPWIEAKGVRERTRTCTEPVNGGEPCSAQGAAKEECNDWQCADTATYSQWSAWRCKDVCYNPQHHKNDTWRERSRTCTDGMPKHSIVNCDKGNSLPLVEEAKTCGDEFRLPMCPKMTSLTVEVCDQWEAGTDDNVQLEFRNSFHSETCTTAYLDDDWTNDWGRGSTKKWSGYANLAGCRGNSFRPIGALSFRFVTNTLGSNLVHDDLTLCKVEVQFGKPGVPGYSIWLWEGSVTNNFDLDSGWSSMFNSRSDWTPMVNWASG